jgi:hypothetical protein
MRPRFQLNAWRIQFSPEQFSVRTERYKDSYDLRRRRAELEGEWFLLRKRETVMGLALSKHPKVSFGTWSVKHSASSHEGLRILTARLNQALPAFLPDYAPLRWRKFRFLSRKTELVRLNSNKGTKCDTQIRVAWARSVGGVKSLPRSSSRPSLRMCGPFWRACSRKNHSKARPSPAKPVLQGYRQPGGVSRRGGHGSAVAWQHLNLLGEYDFSDEKLRDSIGIRPQKLVD